MSTLEFISSIFSFLENLQAIKASVPIEHVMTVFPIKSPGCLHILVIFKKTQESRNALMKLKKRKEKSRKLP